MKNITIGNKIVGEKEPCFVIAEAGINHNGNFKLAKKLVDVASKAGVDAVKFQTFHAESVVTSNIGAAAYMKKALGNDIKQLDLLKNVELTYDDFKALKKYCEKKNILFLSTPHSFDAIDFLADLIPAYKFGSGDLTNIPALQYAARKKKPMILGTGMATMQEVKEAVDSIKLVGNDQIIVLHCTTTYPCPPEKVNLRAIQTMKNELVYLVGYSDHTLGNIVPVAAVTMGAVVLEKHFTIDRNLPGPDHRASLEPDELKEMMKTIREVEKVMGNGIKKPTEEEENIKKIVRKSIVAKIDISKGEIVTENMFDIKRPGTGIEPKYLDRLTGKRTKHRVKKDEVLTWEMIE